MSPNAPRLRLALLIFFSWIVVTSLLLFYLGNRYYGRFDQRGNWHSASINIQRLGLPAAPGMQLVHVFDAGCGCNLRAKTHIRELEKDIMQAQARQYFLNSRQLASAGFNVPATPAVLIFSAGELIYAGPYASGPLCAIDQSVIAPLLRQAVILPGLWLNGETSTCRCLISPP